MTDLPAPLTPPDCDLRDFAFMPLEIRRVLTSATWVLGTPKEKVAALTLWCESWHQVPAASLPDDDKMLSHLSGAGTAWRKVREHVLRGWVRCSDGRLYHPVVAEKALESWEKKQAQRERSRRANAARWASHEHPATDPTSIPQASHKDTSRTPQGVLDQSHNDPKGQGQGQGQKKEKETPQPPAPAGTGGASANDSQGEEAAEDRPPGWRGQWRGLRSTGGNPRAQAAPPPPPPIAEPTDPLWPRLRAQGVKIHDWRAWIARLHRETLPTGETRLIAPDAAHAAYVRANYAIPLAAALRTRIVVEVASA